MTPGAAEFEQLHGGRNVSGDAQEEKFNLTYVCTFHIWSPAGMTVAVVRTGAFIIMISPLWLPATVNGSHSTTASVSGSRTDVNDVVLR